MDDFNKSLNNAMLIFNKKIDQAFMRQSISAQANVELLGTAVRTVLNFGDYTNSLTPASMDFDCFRGDGPITLEMLRHLAVAQKIALTFASSTDPVVEQAYEEQVRFIKEKSTYYDNGEYVGNSSTVMWLARLHGQKAIFLDEGVIFRFTEDKLSLESDQINQQHLFSSICASGFTYQHQIEGVEMTSPSPINKASAELLGKLEAFLVRAVAVGVRENINPEEVDAEATNLEFQELYIDPSNFMQRVVKETLLHAHRTQQPGNDVLGEQEYSIRAMPRIINPEQCEDMYVFEDEKNQLGYRKRYFVVNMHVRPNDEHTFEFKGDEFPYVRLFNSASEYFVTGWEPFRTYLDNCHRDEYPFDKDPTWKPLVDAFKSLIAFRFLKLCLKRVQALS